MFVVLVVDFLISLQLPERPQGLHDLLDLVDPWPGLLSEDGGDGGASGPGSHLSFSVMVVPR